MDADHYQSTSNNIPQYAIFIKFMHIAYSELKSSFVAHTAHVKELYLFESYE